MFHTFSPAMIWFLLERVVNRSIMFDCRRRALLTNKNYAIKTLLETYSGGGGEGDIAPPHSGDFGANIFR